MTTSPESDPSAPEPLPYRCPHCSDEIEVLTHLLGETIACPNCGKPIHVEAPPAKALTPHGNEPDRTRPAPPAPTSERNTDQASHHGEVPQAERPVDDEHTDMVIHPVVFRRHFFATAAFAVLFVLGVLGAALSVAGIDLFGFSGMLLLIPGVVALLVSGFFLAKWYIASRMQSLTLTSERLIYRYGIVNRGTSEMRHEDVRNLTIDQNIMERLLKFGDIAVSSSGQDEMEIVINDIPRPEEVADFVRVRQ